MLAMETPPSDQSRQQPEFWLYQQPEVQALYRSDSVLSQRLHQVEVLDTAVAADPENEVLSHHRDIVRNMLEENCRAEFPHLIPPPEQ